MALRNSRLLHLRFHEELRRSAVGDAGLPDRGTVYRAGVGEGTTDGDGVWTPPARTVVHAGCFRVQPEPTQDRIVIVGDQAVTLHRYRVSTEWDADQIRVDDILVLDTSADPQLAGRPFVVRDVHYDTFQVRRYLLVEDHPDQLTPEA